MAQYFFIYITGSALRTSQVVYSYESRESMLGRDLSKDDYDLAADFMATNQPGSFCKLPDSGAILSRVHADPE